MKPPSLAASAAACAAASSHRPNAAVSSGVARAATIACTARTPRAPACPGFALAGLVTLEGVVPLLGQGLDLERHLGQQLLAARRVGGRLDRRHGLLGRLDGAAGVGQRYRKTGHERCSHDSSPLVFRESLLAVIASFLPARHRVSTVGAIRSVGERDSYSAAVVAGLRSAQRPCCPRSRRRHRRVVHVAWPCSSPPPADVDTGAWGLDDSEPGRLVRQGDGSVRVVRSLNATSLESEYQRAFPVG